VSCATKESTVLWMVPWNSVKCAPLVKHPLKVPGSVTNVLLEPLPQMREWQSVTSAQRGCIARKVLQSVLTASLDSTRTKLVVETASRALLANIPRLMPPSPVRAALQVRAALNRAVILMPVPIVSLVTSPLLEVHVTSAP